MKTIFILTDSDFVGGAETNYQLILPLLKKRGWRPIFISSGEKNLKEYFSQQQIEVEVQPVFHEYYSFSVKGKVSVTNILRTWMSMLKNRSILKKLIRKFQPSAIVSNSMVSHWLLSSVRLNRGCRRVMHLHDIIDRGKAMGLYGMGLDAIAGKMDTIITVSDPVRNQLRAGLQQRVKKIYNPVLPFPSSERRRSGPLRIGMFARYAPWKGHRDFIEIASRLAGPGLEFTSFGNTDGNECYYRELCELVTKLPNASFIQLNGFCHQVAMEMMNCDLILHLSLLPEPATRILAEANACGVPVFAYESGGVRELFEQFHLAGKLVRQEDKDTMISLIRQFDRTEYEFPDLAALSPELFFSEFEKAIS